MSRVGQKPIEVPEGVQVTIGKGVLSVKGPKGELSLSIPASISVVDEGQRLAVSRASDSKGDRALHGTIRSLIANMVTGVSNGFEKVLQIIGVGYRAKVEGKGLVMQLGFSHPVEYPIPEGINLTTAKDNSITVTGCDKQLVGQVAAEIRGFYPPEPYKGKGIRYKGEWVRRKAGKAMAT